MSTLAQMEVETGSGIEILRPADDEIAALAYRLWTDRGCPTGSPEEDWFQAETELKSHPKASARTA